MVAPAPKKQKMSFLKSKILQPSLTSHYEVYMSVPTTVKSYMQTVAGLTIDGNKTEDRITVPCTEASLPGSRLATHELKDDYTGFTQKHAYRRLYDDSVNFTFYVDAEEYYIIRFFEAWLSYITQEGEATAPPAIVNKYQQNYSQRMAFPRDYYATELSITKFERDYNLESGKLQYTFADAYPLGISAMPMSYDSSQLMKCSVEFQFSRYLVTGAIKTS